MTTATLKRPPGRSKKDAPLAEMKPSHFTPPVKLDREVDKTADEMAKQRVLPLPPGKKLSFDETVKWIGLLSPEMWHHVVFYLYREHPKIIRQLKDTNSPRYIDCISKPFDMEYMIEHHGGGKYSMTCCDTDAKIGTSSNRLFECDFEINESKYEPKLDYEELDVNSKQNMAYVGKLQFRGILDGKGKMMPPPAPDPAPAANADMMKSAFQFVREMRDTEKNEKPEDPVQKTLVAWALEQTRKGQEQNSPTAVAELIKALKEVMPQESGARKSEALEIIAALKSLQPPPPPPQDPLALLQAAKEIFAPAAAERNDNQIDQLDKILEFAQKLGGITRGGGGDRSGWEVGLEYVKELAPPLTQIITNVMGVNRGLRPMPPPGMPGAAAPGVAAFDPYANPAAMQAHSRSVAQQQPPAAPAQAMPPTPPNELAGLVQAYGGLVLQHLNMGTPGHVFGDYVTFLLGNATHAQICAQGEPALVQALMSVPEIAMFGQPRIEKFVNEFVHFQEFIDREEEEDEDEEEAPITAKTKRAEPVNATGNKHAENAR